MKKIFAIVLTLCLLLTSAAFAEGTIKIAVAAPMTGDNAEYGIGFANAAKLMAKQWNDKGGVKVGDETYTVEVVEYDDKSDNDEAQVVAETIVSDPDIWGVIGHFTSGVCMATAPTYQDYDYINISPSSSQADYSLIGDFIFRNNTVIKVETYTGAEIAVKDLGGKAIGILSIDTEWGQTTAEIMKGNIEAVGGNFALQQEVSADAVDFATEITNFKDAGVDVVMVAGMYGTLAPFAVACKNSGYEVGLVGCSNAYTDNLLDIAGDAAEGVCAPVTFFAGDPSEKIQAFVKAYTEAYGGTVSSLTSQAYDSTGILLEAIQNAGVLDRQAIRDAVAAIEYDGVSGFTTFDENGDAMKTFTKIQVRDGAFQLAEF
ncbi:MAG: ABC transporter substrate-binding protein [Clostridia bacterium]|nr:ABC transporter substrate-binding protein [Clostridia bacterium]